MLSEICAQIALAVEAHGWRDIEPDYDSAFWTKKGCNISLKNTQITCHKKAEMISAFLSVIIITKGISLQKGECAL